jgi:hypothetical protein
LAAALEVGVAPLVVSYTQVATAWLEKYRQLWAARFDELDRVIEDLKQREKFDGRKKRE